MKISHRWLLRYLDAAPSPDRIAEVVTMSGFPVDHVVPQLVSDGEDHQLDVEVTWNRPDCQCHLGVAREVAGLIGASLVVPPADVQPEGELGLEVFNDAPALCPVYTARLVTGVQVGPSPQWLVDLLEAAGQRAVNNVVDITNFVMLETGQPLHAFDRARLRGGRLGARFGSGEGFVAIDGGQHQLVGDDLVIADAEGPVALAGVMGGRDSEVHDGTTAIVLEAALFDPVSVRESSRRHRLSSESSFRFERHVDPAGLLAASDRAAYLLQQICGADRVSPIVAAGRLASPDEHEIELRTAQVERVFGVGVAQETIERVLESLGLTPLACTVAGTTRWRIPSRRPDLRREIDLVEEVVRRVGFDQVPEKVEIPVRPLAAQPELDLQLAARDALVAAGYFECRTAPFVPPGATDVSLFSRDAALRIENPVRADENLLRRSVLGGLLRVARGNRERGNESAALFELAPVYVRDAEATNATHSRELLLVGGVTTGGHPDAKGAVEILLQRIGLASRASFDRGSTSPFHPDRCASVTLGGEIVGFVGELRPGVANEFSLPDASAAFELDLGALASAASLEVEYRSLSRFQPVHRDLAWVVEESVAWARIEAVVRRECGAALTDLQPFDVYRGEGVGPGRKSVAFRMELRPRSATFTSAELDELTRRIVDALALATGGALRA